jgi:hypothetical protein
MMIFLLGMITGVIGLAYLVFGLWLSVIAEHDGGFKWVFAWPIFSLINIIKHRREIKKEELLHGLTLKEKFLHDMPKLNVITDEISPETYDDVVEILTSEECPTYKVPEALVGRIKELDVDDLVFKLRKIPGQIYQETIRFNKSLLSKVIDALDKDYQVAVIIKRESNYLWAETIIPYDEHLSPKKGRLLFSRSKGINKLQDMVIGETDE